MRLFGSRDAFALVTMARMKDQAQAAVLMRLSYRSTC